MRYFKVKVLKRQTREVIAGIMSDDGLQSLWAVRLSDGTTRYVTALDTFLQRVEDPFLPDYPELFPSTA